MAFLIPQNRILSDAQLPIPPESKTKAAALEEKFDSPRLAALVKEVKTGNHAALETFWLELK